MLSKHNALSALLDAWARHEALRPQLLFALANILAYGTFISTHKIIVFLVRASLL